MSGNIQSLSITKESNKNGRFHFLLPLHKFIYSQIRANWKGNHFPKLPNFKFIKLLSQIRIMNIEYTRLSHRTATLKVDASRSCPICNSNGIEDLFHFFSKCPTNKSYRSVLYHVILESAANFTTYFNAANEYQIRKLYLYSVWSLNLRWFINQEQ